MYNHIDLTLLKPFATFDDYRDLCLKAIENHTASVCVPSSMVRFCKNLITYKNADVKVCTVIGFPLGNCSTDTKLEEAKLAILEGADELDMVINLTWLKSRKKYDVISEVNKIAFFCHRNDVLLKVIVETCYLTKEEKEKICTWLVEETNADYIKTSTGFGTGGATIEDVKLFSEIIKKYGHHMKIKASGGIRTKEEVKEYLKYCDRIGMSCLPK